MMMIVILMLIIIIIYSAIIVPCNHNFGVAGFNFVSRCFGGVRAHRSLSTELFGF